MNKFVPTTELNPLIAISINTSNEADLILVSKYLEQKLMAIMEQIEANMEATNKEISKGPYFGMRHVQTLLLFLNISVLYMNRSHPAITLVAMTNASKANPNFPEYDWNEQQKSYILSSFFLGYFVVQIPGGYCLRKYGVKISLFSYTLATGLLTLAVPFSVPWAGWQAFCALRFLQGLCQGAYYSATLQHLAQWSPPKERSMLGGVVHAGFNCGLLAAMGVCGFVAPSPLGWPGIFYISGGLCFVWCLLWLILGANNANVSHFITKSELLYIEDSLKNSVSLKKKRLPVPYRAIFRSKAIYALLIARAACLSGYITVEAEWPSYANSVLKMNIEENSLYSALPPLFAWLSLYVFTFSAHFITKRNCMSLTAMRKSYSSIGMWGSALGAFAIGFLDESHKVLAIFMMTFLHFSHSSTQIGTAINLLDIAPNHADIITSIGNTFTYIVTFLGPIYFGVVVRDEQNREQWQIGFITLALIFCLGDIAFLIWGTAEEQSWNAADFSAKKTNNLQIENIDLPRKVENLQPETRAEDRSTK